MKKIFITRPIPLAGIELLKQYPDADVILRDKDSAISRTELLASVRGIDALLSILTDTIDAKVMDSAGKNLKIIANYAVGTDNIDLVAAAQRNIMVTNTPIPELSETVADHTMMLLLALAHRVIEADTFVRKGKYKAWSPELLLGTDVYKKTIGIIGMGHIGELVARRAHHGFGMQILYESRSDKPEIEQEMRAQRVSLTELLKQSDFVSIHTPLLPSTRHYVSAREFSLMKPTAFLINTARGPIVNETDLLHALKTNQIAGAGLDVFECEPKIGCSAHNHQQFKTMKNLILTPHTASATRETRTAMAICAAQNIINILSHQPPQNPVTV